LRGVERGGRVVRAGGSCGRVGRAGGWVVRAGGSCGRRRLGAGSSVEGGADMGDELMRIRLVLAPFAIGVEAKLLVDLL
jgi:hypothetical protein